MVRVLADKYLVNISEYIPKGVDLQLFDAETGLDEIPVDTDALLIRTVTKINPETFPVFPDNLSFIGTGSAGTDHVDIDYLKQRHITFANAAGCNARSVAEYVAVALLLWAEHQELNIKEYTIGIIGAGHTGGEVQKLMTAMDIPAVAYDPPRAQRDSSFTSASLATVLQSDVLTFHTPLTRKGEYATHHWLDAAKMRDHPFKLIINAARGGIIDEKALLKAFKNDRIGNYILDVWENEPLFDDAIAQNALIKTPHIAGYSIQAKNNATKYIIKELQHHFDLPTVPAPTIDALTPAELPTCSPSVSNILTHLHPILTYQQKLIKLQTLSSADKKKGFNYIRTHHPLRCELQSLSVTADIANAHPILCPLFSF